MTRIYALLNVPATIFTQANPDFQAVWALNTFGSLVHCVMALIYFIALDLSHILADINSFRR